MDLKDIWNAAEPSKQQLPQINSIKEIKSKGLKNPLKLAKKNLLQNIGWSVLIGLIYVPIIFYFHFWQIQLFIGITFIFAAWAAYTAIKLYQSIQSNVTANNLLSELVRVKTILNQWMQVQLKVSLFIYPISVAGGYFLGGVLGSGKTVDEFLNKPIVIYALIISIMVLTPLSYYLAKWMFKLSFGNVITQINHLLEELTQVEDENL
jgi:hypothetical protein